MEDKFCLRQVSSLEKIRLSDPPMEQEILNKRVFRGERFSYQIGVWDLNNYMTELRVRIESPLIDYIKAYKVVNAPMDLPAFPFTKDDDYITKTPGLMPDVLVPLEEHHNIIDVMGGAAGALWIRLDVPKEFPAGKYPITVNVEKISEIEIGSKGPGPEERERHEKCMMIEVLPISMPEQKLIFSQWLHTDCIATAHRVPVYSEEHWELIDRYMAAAADTGINSMLIPMITPPLDTMYSVYRPCVQLVDIEKQENCYTFNFDKVCRWIAICKKNGIQYYETAHLFSQWGMFYTPNIMVTENGKKDYLFKWGVPSDSPEYLEFLLQFLPQLIKVLQEEGIADRTYFHISDEPRGEHVATYERIAKTIKPILGDIKRIDALSHYEFYEKGLVDVPVTCTTKITPFLEHHIENQWAYYCCSQHEKVGNRFLAMPSYRNRILGLQLYKYKIQGFLQWAFNFYNARCSTHPINPYLTTSAEMTFPSGDPFSVYPGEDGPLLSLRTMVFYDALQDIAICWLLEEKLGHDKVVELIEREAGMELKFDAYPKSADFLLNLRETMIDCIIS